MTKIERDIAHETAALNKPVNPSGAGEDPAVKALLDPSFATLPENEALEIKLQLQAIIRGQSAILNNMDSMGQELQNIKRRVDEYEDAQNRFETDREKFIEEINDASERMLRSAEEREQMRARAFQDVAQRAAKKRAGIAVDAIQTKEALMKEKTEQINVAGHWISKSLGQGQTKMVLMPEIININGVGFRLEPGVHTVPHSVAEAYRNMMLTRAENEERKDAISAAPGKMRQDTKVIRDWNKVSEKYNSPTAALQVASGWSDD